VDKLLQRIKLQAAGQAEAPPITLPDWITDDDLAGDDEEDDIEAFAAGARLYPTNLLHTAVRCCHFADSY
jgi:hypothetical protein